MGLMQEIREYPVARKTVANDQDHTGPVTIERLRHKDTTARGDGADGAVATWTTRSCWQRREAQAGPDDPANDSPSQQ